MLFRHVQIVVVVVMVHGYDGSFKFILLSANMKKQNHVNAPPPERVSLPEKVAHAYYSHGLICSSHPVIVLCFAISIVLLCS